jgi:hypothetical protein
MAAAPSKPRVIWQISCHRHQGQYAFQSKGRRRHREFASRVRLPIDLAFNHFRMIVQNRCVNCWSTDAATISAMRRFTG